MKSSTIRFVLFAAGLVFVLLPMRVSADKPDYNSDVTVKTLLRTSTNSAGQTIEYPLGGKAEVSILIVEIPPGKQTGWHKHPVPLFGYVLSGQVTVHFADGKKNTFRQGDPMAECVDVLHNGINEGATTTKLLIFVAGEKNVPFTKKAMVDQDGKPLDDKRSEP
jgi:quercetin dioxygenase-like cupin family protein